MIQKYKKMASWSKRIQGIEFTLNSLQGLQTLQQWFNHSQDQNPQQTEHFDLLNDNHNNDKKKQLLGANNGNVSRSDTGCSRDQSARIIIPQEVARNPN